MKAAEKAGAKFVYPTKEELLAEKEEAKPILIFTIYDSSGNIMRKLNKPLAKGYKNSSWDLSYLRDRGAKVPPGKYKVAIDKNINGVFYPFGRTYGIQCKIITKCLRNTELFREF